MQSKRYMKGLGLNDLRVAALAIVVLVIIVSIGATVLGEVRDTQTAGEYDYNITDLGLQALDTFGDWFDIIVIVIIAAVVIGLILLAFSGAGRGGGV